MKKNKSERKQEFSQVTESSFGFVFFLQFHSLLRSLVQVAPFLVYLLFIQSGLAKQKPANNYLIDFSTLLDLKFCHYCFYRFSSFTVGLVKHPILCPFFSIKFLHKSFVANEYPCQIQTLQ